MMLADPSRVHADRIGINRLPEDVSDQRADAAPIVGVVIVASVK
jgi:hypothetical protein